MGKTIGEMTAEIREVNIEKGWRNPDGTTTRTWPEVRALLHSEIAEALDAYRHWGLDDATEIQRGIGLHGLGRTDPAAPLPKPEGVGSELADVLIRLLDMCDEFEITPFDMDCEIGDVAPGHLLGASFGDHMDVLHEAAAGMRGPTGRFRGTTANMLRRLVGVAEHHGIDLDAEYERKIAYNRTRSFRHGGRAL